MKQLRYLLFSLFIFISINGYAQLNQFLIEWWHYEKPDDIIKCNPLPDWVNTSLAPTNRKSYFDKMKAYGFNAVDIVRYYVTSPVPNDLILIDAKNAGLNVNLKLNDVSNTTLAHFDDNMFNIFAYDIADEPAPNGLSAIVPFANAIRDHNSNLLRCANLLPAWASQFNNSDFYYNEGYIQEYINTSKPNILSFDDYPIAYKNNCFFRELYDFGSKSTENSIPFIYFLTPLKEIHDTYFGTSTNSYEEFKYAIYGALAFGAKGFNYWPGFEWAVQPTETPFKLNFNQTVYNNLKDLHIKLTSNSNILLNLNFASAYHYSVNSTIVGNKSEQVQYFGYWNGKGGNQQSINKPGCGIAKDEFAKFVFSNPENPFTLISNGSSRTDWDNVGDFAITFMTDNNNGIYFWILNKGIVFGHNLTLNLKSDNINNVVDVLNSPTVSITNTDNVYIAPGEAKLFKITKKDSNSRISVNICNTTYSYCNPTCDYNTAPLVSADNILIGTGTNCPVIFEGGTYSSFMAHKITIGKGVKMLSGSHVRLKKYTNSNTINLPQGVIRFNPNQEIQKSEINNEIKLFPNPTKGEFKISINIPESVGSEIRVFDNMGRFVKVVIANTTETDLSLENEPAGIYYVRFAIKDKYYNRKIVKL